MTIYICIIFCSIEQPSGVSKISLEMLTLENMCTISCDELTIQDLRNKTRPVGRSYFD